MHTALKNNANDRNLLRELAGDSEQRWQRLLGRGRGEKIAPERNDPPATFIFPYLVSRPTPYQGCDHTGREVVATGGVLHANAVVWLEQPVQAGRPTQRVAAFTPSAGLVHVSTRHLSIVRKSA